MLEDFEADQIWNVCILLISVFGRGENRDDLMIIITDVPQTLIEFSSPVLAWISALSLITAILHSTKNSAVCVQQTKNQSHY